MPRVPIAEPRVQYQAPNVPSPVKTPAPPEEAFGGGVAQARGNVGKAVVNLGETLSKYAIDLEERKSQKIANETVNAFHDELFSAANDATLDKSGRPKGFFRRQMNQAIGSSTEFDPTFEPIYKKYREMPMSPNLRNQLDETLRSKYGTMREAVFKHEQAETDKAEKVALETRIKNAVTTARLAPSPIDLSNNIGSEKGALAATLGNRGFLVDDIKVEGAALAGKMTDASVSTYLESNPRKANEILELMERDHGPLPNYGDMKKTIEGKMDSEIQLEIWGHVKNFKRADGTVDSAAGQAYVYKMNLPADKKKKYGDFVNTMASVYDANFKEAIIANDRSYANALVDLHAKGASFEEALQLSVQHGRDLNDVTVKQDQAKKLFTSKESAFDTWINSMPQEYKNAAKEAEAVFKATYPKKKDTVKIKGLDEELQGADAVTREFQLQALGKTPAQMRELSAAIVKDVVVKPGVIWDDKEPSWKISYEDRLSIDQAWAVLDNSYGPNRVAKAKIRLRKLGKPITPIAVDELISYADNLSQVEAGLIESGGTP